MTRPSNPVRPYALILLLLLCGAMVASAQTYPRGFVPPADYEKQLEARKVLIPVDKDPLPSFYDWRDHGGVTPAKNQGDCGSCWAFAATGEMESKILIYYGLELNLSEQQIVSCNPYGSGCDGGWAGAAYYVFMHYGGILENCMPYAGSDNIACRQDEFLKFTDMDNWVHVMNDEDQIKTLLMENGPVCTSVDANDAWDGYSGGIIDVPGNGTNHLVLIVGWDDRMGADGVWIVKNSWGAGWGDSGYCYVEYGACNIGTGVTSMNYTPPTVEIGVSSPEFNGTYYGDATMTVEWYTGNETVDAVDIYYGTTGACQENLVAENVPNTGSYEWVIPNVTTDRGTVLVFPSEGTHRGFGFCEGEFDIIGHQTRYVAPDGGDMPPYDAPHKAARSLSDAVLAGAGRDTILVAGGEYLEDRVSVNSQAHLMGGWSSDFTVHDPETYETRVRGVSGTISFNVEAGDHCGLSHMVFHDCQGWSLADPVPGRHGGAIIAADSSPTIANCEFLSNRADPGNDTGWGGAIMAYGGSPVVRDCRFEGNIASHGGALALSGCDEALVERCEFVANANSDSTTVNKGAGIYVNGGSATIRQTELRGGGAGRGGGLALDGGAVVTASDLLINGNRAVHDGAGVSASDATFSLTAGEICGNSSLMGNGAGVHHVGGELALLNVRVDDNQAVNIGGGIYAQSVDGVVRHGQIRGNQAGTGGGAFMTAANQFEFTDNVILENIGGGVYVGGAGMVADYNLAFGNTGGDFMGPMAANDLVADPQLMADHAPGLHSPLVDTGSGLGGLDWDGGAADRGLFGGEHAAAMGPARVTGLVGNLDGATVTLNWNAVDGAESYVVYRDSAAVFVPAADLLCASVTGGELTCQDILPSGETWYYVVAAVDADGHMGGFSARHEPGGSSGTPVEDQFLPSALAVTGIAPNPFNPRATVNFAVPASAHVSLQVFDMRGRLVSTLVDEVLSAGLHTAVWDGTDARGRSVAAGVYLVRASDGRNIATQKALLAK